MEKMMWVFTDLANGDSAVFDDEAKARKFVKEYGNCYYDWYEDFPTEGAEEDYTLKTMPLNPSLKEFFEKEP